MKHRTRFALLLAAAGWIGGAAAPAFADPITLQDLLNGGSVVVGDKLFHDFSNFSSTAVGGKSVDPSKVFVIPTIEGGKFSLTFVGNGQFTAGPNASQLTHFEFDVYSRNTNIKTTTLDMIASAHGDGYGQVAAMFGQQPGLSVRATSASGAHYFGLKTFDAEHDRGHIGIDVDLVGGISPGERSGIDQFSFSVEQPEPGTLALFAVGAVGLLGYRWRRGRAAKAIRSAD
jgi:hypothetical protein